MEQRNRDDRALHAVHAMRVALSIAGSDSGGGAGIQADLRSFAALGVWGTTALTAITAQNTVGVRRVDALPPEAVRAQIDAVMEDFTVSAVKIGMLGTRAVVEAVAAALDHYRPRHVVVDPVMVAGSGDRLLADDAIHAVRDLLVPRATVLTPNLPEAGLLLGRSLRDDDGELRAAARDLHMAGAANVLLKGGHRGGDADDLFVGEDGEAVLSAERIPGRFTHGTGCTLSSAIAALLARERSPEQACREAKEFVTGAIAQGMQLGAGQGNLHHFWEYYGAEGLPV